VFLPPLFPATASARFWVRLAFLVFAVPSAA
jgi:hypothetical protein